MFTKKRRALFFTLALVFVMATVMSACGNVSSSSGDTAATILTGGIVYTVEGDDWDLTPSQAVAIDKDGKILAVGTDADIKKLAGKDTEKIDLAGKIVLPGFWDTHIHFPGTGITELFLIDLYSSMTKEATIETIQTFVDENPDLDAYYGSGFSMSISDSSNGPKKEWLDEISSDKPIILNSNDVHSYWLNTKALEMMDITTETKLPNGSIPIDPATGELWGVVTDGWDLITMAPEWNDDQKLEGLNHFQNNIIAWGYTGLMGVAPYQDDITSENIKKYLDDGNLKVRLNLAAPANPEMTTEEAIIGANEMRELFKGTDVNVSTIKFFADGVVEGVTAYLKAPYASGAEREKDFRSHLNYDTDKLLDFYNAALDNGYQIHTHSIGDAATADVLDAIEVAQAAHADVDARSVITHLQVVDDVDKVRMAKLGVIGSTQPYWHLKEPEWFDEIDAKNLGEERAWAEYPVNSLIDQGVRVTFSGDHPVTPIDNPFWAIEISVTRNLVDGEYYGVDDITDIDDPTWLLNPEERISVKQAIEAYTINGAYQVFREKEVGSLKAGKFADLIVVDQDILKIDPLRIDSTKVLANYIGGKLVFGKL
jgi:predicted amidohydrolase YtcJ